MEDQYCETVKGPDAAEVAELTRSADQATMAASSAGVAAEAVTDAFKRLIFWESEETRPPFVLGAKDISGLAVVAEKYLPVAMKHPYLPVSEIRAQQLARMRELVELAYRDIPVYQAKYRAAGFSPADLRDWDDIQKIPVITKPELIAAFPERCVNPRYDANELYPTRSSGSSGQTLLIRVDHEAILVDTVQGVRQFALQSGGRYRPEHLLTHVYTVPWWFDSIDGWYQTRAPRRG
jgi:phenylacetate-CoA ligase